MGDSNRASHTLVALRFAHHPDAVDVGSEAALGDGVTERPLEAPELYLPRLDPLLRPELHRIPSAHLEDATFYRDDHAFAVADDEPT